MKKINKIICVAAIAMLLLLSMTSVLSTYLPEGESGTIMIRGYNLVEFSPWASITLIAPFLAMVILSGCQSKAAKELEMMILTAVSILCFAHGVSAGHAWLESIRTGMIMPHVGLALYPVGFLALLMAGTDRNCDEKE